MGCRGSKLEEQRAVAHCRGRVDLLGGAVRHRFALADAHAAYAASLLSLHLLLLPTSDSPSPRLPLPPRRKPQPSPPAVADDSHIRFRPSSSSDDDDDEESDTSGPDHDHDHDHDHDSPSSSSSSPLHHLHHPPLPGQAYAAEPPPQSTFYGAYYARTRPPPPSVSFAHPPPTSETVYYASSDPNSAYPFYNPTQSYSYGYGGVPGPAAASPPRAAAPPPPPSPPRADAWDFFNPFATYQSYYAPQPYPYTPSRSSREAREEEGIPELEEEEDDDDEREHKHEHEVIKEAYGDPKFVASPSSSVAEEGRRGGGGGGGSGDRPRHHSHQPRSVAASSAAEDGAGVVDKEVVSNAGRGSAAEASSRRSFGDASDAAGEIGAQFERASDAAKELGPVLELGKRRYRPKSSTSMYQVSSRMVSAMAPHTSRNEGLVGYEEDKGGDSKTLSLTLQKLYIWERKLHSEVKAEEKMRLLLAKNSKRLKYLDEKGAEDHKIDAMRELIRKLSTRIRIAIQVVDKISRKINKIRDEELWPQIYALIQGLVRMWRAMLECHRIQRQAISEAKNLDLIISGGKNIGEFAMQLEVESMKWIVSFSSWISSQRNFVKSLNGWLALCLNYEPEDTPDGVPPYSLGRIGAPPVFVICNSWSQAMDRISAKEVVDSMQALASNLRHLWEQQNFEQQERTMAIREMDRWAKAVERNTQEIHKEVEALNKKLALVPGQSSFPLYSHLYGEDGREASSLEVSLRRVFEALESFSASSLQAYEDLNNFAEEESVGRENAKVP